MLAYITNMFSSPQPAKEEEEARNKEDAHAKQFDDSAAKLARAMVVHKVDAPIPYAADMKGLVTKEVVNGVPDAFVLHNVLTPEECETYIRISEELGYTDAPISTGVNRAEMMTDVRDNTRVMWEVPQKLIGPIWERVVHLIPAEIVFPNKVWRVADDRPLNERFRFYRYDMEQTFRPHFDGCYRRNSEEQSHFTFIIYLNDGFQGGETIFFPGGENSLWVHKKTVEEKKVNPKVGSALLFRHTGTNSPLHEGAPHFTKGSRKYVLRTDVMYKTVELAV